MVTWPNTHRDAAGAEKSHRAPRGHEAEGLTPPLASVCVDVCVRINPLADAALRLNDEHIFYVSVKGRAKYRN